MDSVRRYHRNVLHRDLYSALIWGEVSDATTTFYWRQAGVPNLVRLFAVRRQGRRQQHSALGSLFSGRSFKEEMDIHNECRLSTSEVLATKPKQSQKASIVP